MVELEFEKISSLEYWTVVDILQFDHKKLKQEEDMKITYDENHVESILKLYVQTLSKAVSKEIPPYK